MASLAPTFGRGAMTNHWIDMQHAKTVLIEGSNVAENHPMAFKWIRKAQENGAKIIHVDPRFTRTSAGADIYARIRPGTDAAFLNTMINYILVNKLYDEDFVKIHTNALFLGAADFDFNLRHRQLQVRVQPRQLFARHVVGREHDRQPAVLDLHAGDLPIGDDGRAVGVGQGRDERSNASVVTVTLQPSFNGPTRLALGTGTSTKNTSLKWRWPFNRTSGRTVMPGVFISTSR